MKSILRVPLAFFSRRLRMKGAQWRTPFPQILYIPTLFGAAVIFNTVSFPNMACTSRYGIHRTNDPRAFRGKWIYVDAILITRKCLLLPLILSAYQLLPFFFFYRWFWKERFRLNSVPSPFVSFSGNYVDPPLHRDE